MEQPTADTLQIYQTLGQVLACYMLCQSSFFVYVETRMFKKSFNQFIRNKFNLLVGCSITSCALFQFVDPTCQAYVLLGRYDGKSLVQAQVYTALSVIAVSVCSMCYLTIVRMRSMVILEQSSDSIQRFARFCYIMSIVGPVGMCVSEILLSIFPGTFWQAVLGWSKVLTGLFVSVSDVLCTYLFVRYLKEIKGNTVHSPHELVYEVIARYGLICISISLTMGASAVVGGTLTGPVLIPIAFLFQCLATKLTLSLIIMKQKINLKQRQLDIADKMGITLNSAKSQKQSNVTSDVSTYNIDSVNTNSIV